MDKKAFNTSNFKWTLDGLRKCIADNRLRSKILFSNEHGAIVHVVSYEDSIILGNRSDWCISQHRCSWVQYVVKRNAVQLFFYRFDKSLAPNKILYGATFDIKDNKVKTYCCFTRDNNPIAKVENFKTDEEALFKVVVIPTFGDIKEALGEAILNVADNSVKVTEQTVTHNEQETMPTDYMGNKSYITPNIVGYYDADDDEWFDFLYGCHQQY